MPSPMTASPKAPTYAIKNKTCGWVMRFTTERSGVCTRDNTMKFTTKADAALALVEASRSGCNFEYFNIVRLTEGSPTQCVRLWTEGDGQVELSYAVDCLIGDARQYLCHDGAFDTLPLNDRCVFVGTQREALIALQVHARKYQVREAARLLPIFLETIPGETLEEVVL